jgi:hypothetical protein
VRRRQSVDDPEAQWGPWENGSARQPGAGRLHRAGELRAIYVPNDADEAMRDLVRARADAVAVSLQAKYRWQAFLLRQGRRHPGRDGRTLAYRRWLTDLRFPSPPQHIALHEYRDTIDETERRFERFTEQLRQLARPGAGRPWSRRCRPPAQRVVHHGGRAGRRTR